MKRLFLCASLVAAVGVWQQQSFGQQPAATSAPAGVKNLGRQEVDALLKTPDRYLMLDLRSPGEIAYWGAFPLYLGVQASEGIANPSVLEKYLSAIPKDREIVTVSGRAKVGEAAAALLSSRGFKVAGTVDAMTYVATGGHLVAFPPYWHTSMTSYVPTPAPPANPGAPAAPKAVKELGRAEIDSILAAPDSVLVLDVRAPGEIAYWGGYPVYLNIPGAQDPTIAHTSLDAISGIANFTSQIPKGKPIVTVSGRANRGGNVGALLEKHGFKIAGATGMMTYLELGGRLVTSPVFTPPVRGGSK